jgi:hypothetical protein
MNDWRKDVSFCTAGQHIHVRNLKKETCWAIDDERTIIRMLNIISENVNQPSLNGGL